MDLEIANGDKIAKKDKESSGFRNIDDDREMQAYASVIYMIHAFHGAFPPEYIEFIEDYIFQKFPILSKVKNIDVMLAFCTKETKAELEELHEKFKAYINNGSSEYNSLILLQERVKKSIKPVHEEDLQVNISNKNPDYVFVSKPLYDKYVKNTSLSHATIAPIEEMISALSEKIEHISKIPERAY